MRTVVIACLAALALPAGAADECERKCESAKSGATLVLDGNTGERREGTTRVGSVDEVKIVVATPNPFHWAYRTAISVEAVGPALAREFLMALGVPALPPEPPKAAAGGPPRALRPGVKCEPAALEEARKAEGALVTGAEKQVETHLADVRTFLEETAGDSIEAECVKVCRSARALVATDVDLPKVRADLAAARRRTDDLIAAGPADKVKPCSDALAAERPKDDDKLTAAEANASADDGVMARVKSVLAARYLLATVHTPSAPDEPYRVQLALFRTDLRTEDAPEEAVGDAEIRVGRRILSLAGGVVVSWVQDRKVTRQAAMVPDGAGGTTLGSVFGYERSSAYRPAVLVALNGAICEWSWRGRRFALAGTTGIVAADVEGLEYLLGGAIGFADQTFFLTAGAHFAQIEDIAGGFSVGEPVPAGLADPLPVERRWTSGFAVGLTYRLR